MNTERKIYIRVHFHIKRQLFEIDIFKIQYFKVTKQFTALIVMPKFKLSFKKKELSLPKFAYITIKITQNCTNKNTKHYLTSSSTFCSQIIFKATEDLHIQE